MCCDGGEGNEACVGFEDDTEGVGDLPGAFCMPGTRFSPITVSNIPVGGLTFFNPVRC